MKYPYPDEWTPGRSDLRRSAEALRRHHRARRARRWALLRGLLMPPLVAGTAVLAVLAMRALFVCVL